MDSFEILEEKKILKFTTTTMAKTTNVTSELSWPQGQPCTIHVSISHIISEKECLKIWPLSTPNSLVPISLLSWFQSLIIKMQSKHKQHLMASLTKSTHPHFHRPKNKIKSHSWKMECLHLWRIWEW